MSAYINYLDESDQRREHVVQHQQYLGADQAQRRLLRLQLLPRRPRTPATRPKRQALRGQTRRPLPPRRPPHQQ